MTRTWLILIAALMAGHEVGVPEGTLDRFYGPGPPTTVLSIAANAVGAAYAAVGDAYELVTGPSARRYPGAASALPACRRVVDHLYGVEQDLIDRIEDEQIGRVHLDWQLMTGLKEKLRFIQEGPEKRLRPVIQLGMPSPWVWGNCLQYVYDGIPFFQYENCLAYEVNAADLQECMVDSRRACLERPRHRRICEELPLPPGA